MVLIAPPPSTRSGRPHRLGRLPHIDRPDRVGIALIAVLIGSLLIRLIALRHGLPHAYNADEELHYVPQATRAADGDWYSGYFENPSGFTYLVALVYKAVFPGEDVSMLLVTDPGAVVFVARVVAALLGTLTVALVYLAGRAYADRRVGLVAAAFLGFAYLPVFYSHQALNDVPTLAPLTVAMIAVLRLYERGRWSDLILAGMAVGVAGGTKYLAAPMSVVIGLALLLRVLEHRETWGRALSRLGAAAVATIGGLLALNPFLVLEFGKFLDNFTGQSAQAATTKLGQTGSAWLGYPQTLLWGFGVIPLALAVVGAFLWWRRDRARTWLLITFPVLLYLSMGLQERWFGRWMLPAYPALAILAGYGAVRVAEALARRSRRIRATAALVTVAGVALLQPVADSVRSDLLLSRTDTRAAAEEWILREVPAGSGIVVEPAVPGSYRRDLRDAGLVLFAIERPFQDYERDLQPELIDTYRAEGFCWIMVNGHQRERGLAAGLLGAADYYRRLSAEAEVVFADTPFSTGAAPPGFSYDFSFNYYPPAYHRPGPVVEVHRLHDCG